MNSSAKLSFGFTLALLVVCIINSCSVNRKSEGNAVNEKSSGDSLYQVKPFIKKDPFGAVRTTGQFLNGKRDGCWRYYSSGKAFRIEMYENGILVGVHKPEMDHSFESYTLFLPDEVQREYTFRNGKAISESFEEGEVKIVDKFSESKEDTTTMVRTFNDEPVYGMVSGPNRKPYSMVVLLTDSTHLEVNLKNKSYTIKSD